MNLKAEQYIKKSMKMAKKQDRDIVITPEWIAKDIIQHFNPHGFILDPCKGTGNFYNNYPTDLKDWCVIIIDKYNMKHAWFSKVIFHLVYGLCINTGL